MAKVRTAIYGKDLKVELKNYDLTESGNKISIVPTGTGYFCPDIGTTKFLDWPSWRKFLFFGPRTYTRIYFALKKGSSCVNFLPAESDQYVYGPDQEQQKQAMGNLLATEIGKDTNKGTPWYAIVLLVINILMLLVILRIGGVIA